MLHLYCLIDHQSPPVAPSSPAWQFDLASALIGAALTLLLAWVAYHFREPLRLGWETVTAPVAQLYRHLQASAEDRYREMVTDRTQTLVFLGQGGVLHEILIEAKLLTPPPLPQSASDDEHVPPGPQAFPLLQVLGGYPKLAILGASGAGRTTLLAHVASVYARKQSSEERTHSPAQTAPDLDGDRLPIYVLLSAMDWRETNDQDGQQQDTPGNRREDAALERLVSAARDVVGGSAGMTQVLRQRMSAGRAIVLADGWDELSPPQRKQAAAWISELSISLPQNIWLVSAGLRGYAPLVEVGFVPLTLAPWSANQAGAFAERWFEAHTSTEQEPSIAPYEVVRELRRAAQMGTTPLEMALRAFVQISGERPPARRAELFDCTLNLLLRHDEEPWFSAACRAALGQIALNAQQGGRHIVRREEIEAAVEAALPPLEERPARAVARVTRALTGERGLLRPVGPGSYAFIHSLWQAYLTARQLVAVNPQAIIERLDDAQWSDVLHFYAELGEMGPVVAAWLRKPDDMFRTRLRTLSSWIRVAPEDATWRDGAMAVLARAFLQSDQHPQVQQELAEALAATRTTGIAYFFKQALRNSTPAVRDASALGLIQIAGGADLALLEALLQEESPAIRQGIVRKLASLEMDAATRMLGQILIEGDDSLRPLAAEALAMQGDSGAALLDEAIETADVAVRRAAVFGLAQLGAREALEQVAREDEQWIVRSAAAAALEEITEYEQTSSVTPPPQIEQLPWLISWAASRGEGIGLGDAARQMLLRALKEGDAPVRLAATRVLTQVGRPADVDLLRTVLADPNSAIGCAALDALAAISRRYDLRIE